MAEKWIQKVDEEMKRKGTVGAFTRQAERAGMSVHDFATRVMNNKEDYSEKTRERANFALTMEKIAKDRKKKMAHGGMTQGYNSQLDESMGMRLGREKNYKQSLKDRRDESKAANKMLGRRAYSSVQAMDKDDRMMMHGGETEYGYGGKTKMAHGGKTKYDHGGYHQGYDDEQDESLGMRTGRESSKKQSMKARRDDSYGKFGKRDEEDRDITMARGGSVEGKIDRDRYVKLRREKDKEIAKLKKEKGALRKETLKKAEKDCDTDVKRAEADCDKETKSLKKDIGKKVAKSVAEERKEYKRELDSIYSQYDRLEEDRDSLEEQVDNLSEDLEKAGKKDDTEALLLGGIAGIFLGAFLGGR